ncbi:MAG TPA: ParB/RepB/Spo0J family partition protein [Gammaproteobacteria bacterium]|nr:ParB/RepB/Spo0J family partition protein [Gammaproteobacteria bacterium]
MNKRRSLGRGLDALLSSARPAPPPPTPERAAAAAPVPASSGEGLREVPVELLRRGKYQPRVDMREDSLTELAESIKAQGVVQPIVVRPLPNAANGETEYEIVAGERRWRAAQMAGLATIPAVIREIPDESAVAVALIENIQRENLNPLEEARSLHQLIEEFGLTHADAAIAVGRSRATVTNLLRLLELPRPVREMVERRDLDMGHARALLGLESPDLTVEIAEQARKHQWSVRTTEEAVRRHSAPQAGSKAGKAAPRATDPNVRRLETELSETLGAAVAIEHGPKGGRVVIRYNGLEELEGILGHIK